MWAEATSGEGGDGRGVVRACVQNLIVYSPADASRAEIDTLLEEVYERNPGRALVIFADREAPEASLEAYVSTRCSLSSKGARQVCGEQVTIEGRGASVERAASAVAPLLVPDVPVFLWWKDIPHYEDKLFERLVEISDRVVIDSAAFDNPHRDVARLAEVILESPDFMAVSDLNWGRLTPWRALVASFWDASDYAAHLRALEQVGIVYDRGQNTKGELPPDALLLTGWLISRLGWEVEQAATVDDEGVANFHLKSGAGHQIRLTFRPSDQSKEGAAGIRSITLLSGLGGAEFHVELKPEGTKLETLTKIGDSGRTVGRVSELKRLSEGRRLGNELDILARDRVYERSVVTCARLLESLAV